MDVAIVMVWMASILFAKKGSRRKINRTWKNMKISVNLGLGKTDKQNRLEIFYSIALNHRGRNIRMNFAQLLSNIHWIPVIVVAVASIILSAAWHIPVFLKLLWKEGINPTSAEPPVNIPLVLGVSAILYFINIAGLGAVVAGQGLVTGLLTGLAVSIIWVIPATVAIYLFAGQSLRFPAIDGGLYVVLFSLAGLVLGIW